MTFRRLAIAALMILLLAAALAARGESSQRSVTSPPVTPTDTQGRPPMESATSGHPPDQSYEEAAQMTYDRVLTGLGTLGQQVADWAAHVAELDAAERARMESLRGPSTGTTSMPNGPLSHDQLVALARCESGLNPYAGDPSPWRTGFWGIEAGYPIGHMSVAEQEAWVQRIWAQHGQAAWGCPIR